MYKSSSESDYLQERKRVIKGNSVWKEPLITLSKGILLILHFAVNVKVLYEAGKKYPWPKPEVCPKCKGTRLWGHGYVPRYFEGYWEPLWVKRFRCPDCRAVHTCRPDVFFKRYRYPVIVVILCLLNKIVHGRWLRCIRRQNQLSWLRTVAKWNSQKQTVKIPSIEHLKRYLAEQIPSSVQCATLRL